jgi:hypothetical protein
MSVCDQRRELAFLAAAARGHESFVTQVRARLEAGEPEFGDSWAWIGIRRHLTELREEAADLGAWSVLADQALDHEQQLADADRDRTRAVLELAARRGAQVHQLLSSALRSLDQYDDHRTNGAQR